MAKILLIDDDEALRELLEVSLQLEGYEVVMAEDRAAALRLLRESESAGRTRVDLVAVDFRMPLMDELRFLRALHAEFGTAAPPVVVVTVAQPDDARQELMAAGARAVFAKPLQRSEFLATIQAIMQTRAA